MSKNTFFRVSNESPQSERRAVAANDRRARQGATYHDFAAAEQGTVQGRFAAEAKSAVVGSSPVAYPRQPSNSPWASEPVGLEPPLGEDLSAAPIVGEAHEVAASLGEAYSKAGIKNPTEPWNVALLGGDERSPGATPPHGQQRRRRVSPRRKP